MSCSWMRSDCDDTARIFESVRPLKPIVSWKTQSRACSRCIYCRFCRMKGSHRPHHVVSAQGCPRQRRLSLVQGNSASSRCETQSGLWA